MGSFNVRNQTRPFQVFLMASADLLRLAHPYHQENQERRKVTKQSKRPTLPDAQTWRLEKSLSMGSFLMGYAGLEGFVNSVHKDYKMHDGPCLPTAYFTGELANHRAKFISKRFTDWRLENRVFLLVPLCTEPTKDPSAVFDSDSVEWREFQEIVAIRASFLHATSESILYRMERTGPKRLNAYDDGPRNFWPVTRIPRDHRSFNHEDACKIRNRIEWIIERLFIGLDGRMAAKYLSEETMQIIQNPDDTQEVK